MKKRILKLSLVLALGALTFSSCNKAENTDTHESHGHDHSVQYQCPMKCEKDKTYDHAGKCPVCTMDLKEVE